MNEVEKFYTILFGFTPKVKIVTGCFDVEAFTDTKNNYVELRLSNDIYDDEVLMFGIATHEIGHLVYPPIDGNPKSQIHKDIGNLFEDLRVEKKIIDYYSFYSKVFPTLVKQLILERVHRSELEALMQNLPFIVARTIGTLEYSHPQLQKHLQDALTLLLPLMPNPEEDAEFIKNCIRNYESDPQGVINIFVQRFYQNQNDQQNQNEHQQVNENKDNGNGDTGEYESTDSDAFPNSQGSSDLAVEKSKKVTRQELTERELIELSDKLWEIAQRLSEDANKLSKEETSIAKGISAIQSETAKSLIFLQGTLPSVAKITLSSKQSKGNAVSNRGLPYINPVKGEVELRKKVRCERGGLRYLFLIDVSASMCSLSALLEEILATTTAFLEETKNKVAWVQFSDEIYTRVVKKYEQKLNKGVKIGVNGGTHIARALTLAKAVGYDVCVVMSDACISDIHEISRALTCDKFLFLFYREIPEEVSGKFKKVFKISSRRDVLLALRQIERLCVRS